MAGETPKSVLFVPLVAGGKATGVISLQNVDREHAFSESDLQLLETLAGSLSVALENARLVHETRQRNAELALINSVQDAIAGELELQAIYDVVGDRIQEVFDAQVVAIVTSTRRPACCTSRTSIERGERLGRSRSAPIGFRKHVLETREPLLINENVAAEARAVRQSSMMAGEPPKSVLFVPLVVGGKATGLISLQNLDREHAFSESDLQLLDTLAGSLERRARERAAGPRDAAAERRARADQQRPGVDRGRARPAGDLRRRRREAPRGLRRPGRRHRGPRRRTPGSSASSTRSSAAFGFPNVTRRDRLPRST